MDKDLIEYLDKKFDKIDDINERLIKIESNDLSHLLTIDKFDEFVIKDFADVKTDIAELKTIKGMLFL
ncbi:MAG: hypothetical protein LBR15_03595 [Methanobrevibacter sp.]|jgi:hypothetical protein|nr:hypothetical protein [Candidatus Methanovirga australis]